MKKFLIFLILIKIAPALEIIKKYIPQSGSVNVTVSVSSTGDTTWQDLEVLGTLTSSTISSTSLSLTGNLTAATVDINGGNIDGTVIGASSATTGTFTDLSGTSGITGTLQTAAQPNVTSLGTLSSVDIDGGFIDGTPIGQTSASNAVFGIATATTGNITTVNATTLNGTIGTAAQPNITSLGTLGSVDIDGGFIDGTPIGQTSASNAVFGIVTATTLQNTTGNITTVNATTINGTIATAAQPNITSLGTLGAVTVGTLSVNDVQSAGYLLNDSGGSYITGGNVGIGTTSPDELLHVHESSAGTVTAYGGSSLVIERTTEGWIQMLTGNASAHGILFGDDGDVDIGRIRYSHATNVLDFTAGTITVLTVRGDSALHVNPASGTPSGPTTGTIFIKDGNPNDAVCVYLDGGWVVMAGSGSCP